MSRSLKALAFAIAACLLGAAADALASAQLYVSGSGVAVGGHGRVATIEVGATDGANVYDTPWSPPYAGYVGAGEEVEVFYARTPAQIGATGRMTRLTVFSRADGGAVEQREASLEGSYARALVRAPLDATGTLEIWFEMETDAGRKIWDSAFGRNYALDVIPARCSTIRFAAPRDGAWQDPQPDRGLVAGRGLCFVYELERIKALGVPAGSYRGGIVEPQVEGWVEFHDEAGRLVAKLSVQRDGELNMVAIPYEAASARLYFKGKNYYAGGAERWDTNFGQDFRYAVSR